MKRYSALIGMSAAWAVSNVVQAAVAFLTTLVIARGLGPDAFGSWALCMAWAAMLTMMFDLGFGVLLTREAARGHANLGRLVGAALMARLGLLAATAVVFTAAVPWLATDAQSIAALRLAPPIAFAGAGYACLAAVYRARPRSLAAVLLVEAAGALIQCGGSWWMLRHAAGVADLATLAAIVQLAQLAVAALLWGTGIGPRVRIAWPGTSDAWPAVRAAWPFAMAGVIANAQLRVAPLLLGFMSTAAAVASFGAAARIGSLIRMVPQAAFAGALPVLSNDRHPAVRRQFDLWLRVFSLCSAIAIALVAEPIVRILFGPSFSGAGAALRWIAIGLGPTLINAGRRVVLYAAGHEQIAVRWSGVALTVQIVGCAALIPSFGAAGAAAALAIGEAIVWWPLHRPVQAEELARRPVGIVGESPLAG